MPFDDEEYSGTDSDPDDGFKEDMEALRRACLLTGTDGKDLSTTDPHGGATSSAAATTASSSDEDDADVEDDIELVRNLQKRFANSGEPLTLKPLSLLTPEDDCEDDFETLRAIQRRFAAYNDGGLKESAENNLDRPEQVGVTNNIASEKEASDNLFVEQNSNVEEGFPNCVDADNGVPQKPGEHGDVVTTDLVEWHDSGAENVPLPLKTSSLPRQALAFIDAIKKNRACQKFIRSKLMQIEARMEEVKKLKERVKILKDFQVGCKKRTSRALSQKKDARVQLISAVKQRPISKLSDKKTPALCYGPPENPHVAIYRGALTRYPISVSREKWSKKETENLAKGLKQQFQEMLLQQSMNIIDNMDESSGDASEFDNIIASIRDREITPQNIRSFLPKINWEQLASMYIPGHSGAECQARWLNCEDPLINHNPWTNLEEKNLLYIIQQKGLSNWIDIAVSLGTNRTPFHCLARYQRSLNASIIRREWTKEEDDELRAAVEEYGESNWQNVASVIEGRTGTQCSNRWKKTLHPARKRIGRWTPEEDKRLKVAVKLFGAKNWWKIAEFVPGRMQAQCRERWANNLDPSLNLDKWTAEEDLMLEEAIKENGYSWSKVAACVPRRTDNQCRRRWMVLFPDEVPLLRAAKRTQKAAFISNFVDRESERPALGPDDFLQLPAIDPSSEPENVNPSAKKKKKSRQRQKHTEKDASTCSMEEDARLPNGTNGEDGREAGTSGRDLVNGAGKGSRRRKRKSVAGDGTQISVGDCTNGTNGEDGQEVGTSGRDLVNGAGKGSRRRKRKSIAGDDTQISVGDCTNGTNGEDGQEVGTSGRDIVNGAGKGSCRRKRKSIAQDDTQILVGDCTDGTNGQDGREFGASGGDLVNEVGKGSHRRRRKSIVGDDTQISVGDCTNIKNKRRKSKSNRKKNNDAITVQCNLSSLPNSTSEVLCNEEEVHHRKKTKNANRKTKKACPGDEFADLSTLMLPSHLGERDVPEDSRIASETGAELLRVENNKFGEGPQIQISPPCCIQPDIPESVNPDGIVKKLKSTGGASSPNAPVVEVGQDHSTLASSLPQSNDPKYSSSSLELAELGSADVQRAAREKNCASATGVGGRKRPKKWRTRDEALSHQMLEAESGDLLRKKSKKARIEPAERAGDDVLSISRKEVEKTTVESGDVTASSTPQHPELYCVANGDNSAEKQNQCEAIVLRRGARNRKVPEKFREFVMP